MQKSKIVLLFKWLIFVLILYNALSFFNFNKNYNINKQVTSPRGLVTNITSKDGYYILNIKGKENILGYIYNDKINIKTGDLISFTYSFVEVENRRIFSAFDYKNYLKSMNIKSVIEIKEYKVYGTNRLYTLKGNIINRIDNNSSSPYIRTLLLSDKSLIDNNIKYSYIDNGIIHLLCVSGFHVLFLLKLIQCLLSKIIRNDKCLIFLMLMFSLIYLFLSGYSLPIERALLFYFLSLFNSKYTLNISKIIQFILTLNLCLIGRIYLLYSSTFYYTFIISFFIIFYSLNNKKTNQIMVLVVSFISSIPISIYFNYQINFLAIIYTLLFMYIVCYAIYPLCFIVLIIPLFDKPLLYIIHLFEKANLFLSKIKTFNVVFPRINIFEVILMYVFLIIIYKRKNKYFIFLFIFLLIFLKYRILFDSNSYVYFLDVNQADMAVLITNYHKNVSVIDAGKKISYYKNNKDVAFNNIKMFLYSVGIKKINNLVITHGDYDHMGEAINIVEKFMVEKVIFNCGEFNGLEKDLIKVLDKKKIPYYSCIKELNIDKNKLYFLQTGVYDNENDNSNVIYTEIDGYKFMFMGDAGIEKEKDILDKYNINDIDVLKVGHHGSKTSSSKEFINEMNPKYSIISVGKNNRYGHPNKEVLNNLEDSKIYRTDLDGSIMFKIKNNRLKVETCSS